MTDQQQNDNHLDMDAMLSRIQKLLALADPNANDSQYQIEAAMAKVQELLQKNDLTMEQVAAFQRHETSVDEQRLFYHDMVKQHVLSRSYWTEWFVDLTDAVGRSTNCKPLTSPAGAVFIGFKRDTEIASFLFSSLLNRLVEAATAAMEQYKQQYKSQRINPMLLRGDSHPWVWRRNWLSGAVYAISNRLYNMRKQEQSKQTVDKSQALVVLDNAISEYLGRTRPKLKTLGANSMYSSNYGNGYDEGYAAGNTMPIQQGVGGVSATAALTGK